jgi:hypothetical protein
MRTTIELPDGQRAKLLELAAQRGEKGFSSIVQEALDRYFDELASRRQAVQKALSLRGSLSAPDAEALEEHVRNLRANWR